MANCKGCGIQLQYNHPKLPGYTPKKGSDYCQRCFRLMHYDDLTISMKTGIDPDSVLQRIDAMDCLVLWVVDLFDFEASMIPGLSRKLSGKDIIMVATKRDILPETLSPEKIARFVFGRLKELGISIRNLIITSSYETMGMEEVKEAVDMYGHNRPVVVMGRANAGKSTLLNKLMQKSELTSSRYPGTTLDFNPLDIDGIQYIDTPGIEISGSMLMDIREEDLKTIVPYKTIKPLVYQVRGDQSFTIGGLARVDVIGCDHASAVFYVCDRLSIHRGKVENADEFWKKHYGKLLVPTPLHDDFVTSSIRKTEDKMDVVIEGLGWVCVSGKMSSVRVYAPKAVNVTFRKAML